MRYILTAAAAAMVTASAAQATTIDLTYTVEAEVTSYNYSDSVIGSGQPTPYPGPYIGDTETKIFTATLKTERTSGELLNHSLASYGDFDLADGSGEFVIAPFADEYTDYNLTEVGTGIIVEYRVINPDTDAYVGLLFDVKSWSVAGLPEQVAPVPLPASLPLLGIGMAGIAFAKRRKASRSA